MVPNQRGRLFLLCLISICFCSACLNDGHPLGWQATDLLPHGVPITIIAPPEADIKPGKLQSVLLKDLIIKGEDNYDLQIFYGTAMTNDIAALKNEHLQIVQANPYFQKIVKEEVSGFIYQSRIDTTSTYGFHFTKLQGDLEINFQSGMGSLHSLEEIERMYEGVK
ncbi:MAG: hypothetical protein AAGJ82_13955 [Bacteroidota bacterium]